ncbi:MCP four helix bundle domain-containing protein [Alcaligenaceae bacterium]|nr:MCP four helix bundle domain-containing protein [Alcaligenaceae bacterium]
MNWFINMKVGTKLISIFVIGACAAGVIGALGMQSTWQIKSMASLMYERELIGLRHAADARVNMVTGGRAARGALLATDIQGRDHQMETAYKHFQLSRQALDEAVGTLVTDSEKRIATEASAAVSAYEAKLKELIALPSGEPDSPRNALAELLKEALPVATKAENMLTALLVQKQSNADALNHQTEAVYQRTFKLMIALTLSGILLGILAGALLARSLTRQLGGEPGDVARVANAIAQGNLATSIDTSKAVQGSIVQAISHMQASLRAVVGSVRNSSETIAAGSGQIAAGNTDLSQRTEQQAASLTQTAAAMEQLSATVTNNAGVAGQAAQLASSASVAASNGGQVVNDVVVTMAEINESSQKIYEIIGVIDSIAFQTNILALNAAVEAARAGEEGRGFAVVAGEVRSLAQKSAAAAKDIKTLISDSVQKVEAGRKMVDVAGATMQDVVNQVKRVNDLISDISIATTEQTSGLEQINTAVLQLSEVTQQNASLVQESAVAAASLNDQAQQLVVAVGAFKLGDDLVSALATASRAMPVAAPIASSNTEPTPAASKRRHLLPSAHKQEETEEWESF